MKMEEIEKLEEAARKYSGVDKIRLAFWDGAKWQREQSQWVPVIERLPEKTNMVLVLVNGEFDFGLYDSGWITMYSQMKTPPILKDPTHWMELPQKQKP